MKTIMITGTTNGIGKVTATELAREGYRLIMANRNREKSEQLADEIRNETGNQEITLLDLDLASLDSVRHCAAQFREKFDSLDILLNNAGMTAQQQWLTEDGFESQFAINNLATLLLTVELLPELEAAAPSHVVFVTSMMHKFGKIDFNSFRGWDKYNGNAAYSQSKLAIMFNAMELAKRLENRDISVNTLHPGAVATGIIEGYPPVMRGLLRLMFTTPEKGARTSLHVVGLEGENRPTGVYFNNRKPENPGKQLANKALREKVWTASCELAGIRADI